MITIETVQHLEDDCFEHYCMTRTRLLQWNEDEIDSMGNPLMNIYMIFGIVIKGKSQNHRQLLSHMLVQSPAANIFIPEQSDRLVRFHVNLW